MHERLDVIARVFGGHKSVVGIFGPLRYVPADGLQCGAPFPEPPEITARLRPVVLCGVAFTSGEKPGCEFRGVGHRRGVLVDLIPCHEHRLELRQTPLRRIVFPVEEIAGAVGCRFVDNHGHGLEKHSRTRRPQNLLRGLAERGFPDSHLRTVDKAVVAAAAGVGTFRSADLDLAVARRHSEHLARPAHTLRPAGFRVGSLPLVDKKLIRIMPDHAVEHVLDLIAAHTLVGYYKRVEAFAVHKLQPCHVKLGAGAPSPLPGLEEDEPDRFSSGAHLLEPFHKLALRPVEPEQHVLAAELALDEDPGGGPVREIVKRTQTRETVGRKLPLPHARFVAAETPGIFAHRSAFIEYFYLRKRPHALRKP